MTRCAPLDYLRGLMALAVMAFHFQKSAAGGTWDAASPLGRLGVYAVAVFFVLSGLTLALVYGNAPIGTQAGLGLFFKKRAARILPLLWLATLATFALDHNLKIWSWGDLALNLTGLFGLLAPSRDIALGGWSLGCELVFYALFPVLWLFFKKKGWPTVAAAVGLSAAVAGWFAFFLMKKGADFHEQYPLYVQPAQHFFLFAAGAAAGFFQKKLLEIPPKTWMAVLAMAVAAFVLWPTGDHPSELLTSWNRAVFSMVSIVGCIAVFGSRARFSGPAHTALNWLADCSYTIYLLHPIVFRLVKWVDGRFFKMPIEAVVALSVLATLVASHLVFRKFELPMKRLVAG